MAKKKTTLKSAKSTLKQGNIVPQQVAVSNEAKGKISLDQIENGKELFDTIQDLQVKIGDINLYRKKTDYIMEQDLDPSITSKLNKILDNFDTIEDLVDGIEFEGQHYDIDEILLIVLKNYKQWNQGSSTDIYTQVVRI